MPEIVKKFFYAPTFEDEDQSRVAKVLNAILVAVFLTAFLVLLGLIFDESSRILSIIIISIVLLGIMGIRVLMYKENLQIACWLISSLLWLSITATVFGFNGLRDSTVIAYALAIAIPSLLLQERKAIIFFTSITILALTGIYFATVQSFVIYLPQPVGVGDLVILVGVFAVLGVLFVFSTQSLNLALKRARDEERAAAAANAQLQEFNADLENIVTARTQALITSAEIGRNVSTILDQNELVKVVAREIRDAFDYYQVHLYLLNPDGNSLELAAGSGQAGAELVAKKHTIPISKGLVGRTVRSNTAVLAPDVTKVEEWLPNPLLPDTKTEVTVPISIGPKVLGVLDIQHNVLHGLGQNDADLLQSISGQVAIALENGRLLTEARERARQEALINEIGQQIQSATTVESAMQIAVRELGRAINANQTRVQLGTKPLSPPAKQTNGEHGHGEN